MDSASIHRLHFRLTIHRGNVVTGLHLWATAAPGPWFETMGDVTI